MKTKTLHPHRYRLCASFCLTALLGLLAAGCGDKASEGVAPGNPAATVAGSSAPNASATGGGRAPGNRNEAANAAAFEAARKKAEGK